MHLSTDAYRSYVLRFWGGPPRTRGGVAFALSLGCILLAQAAPPLNTPFRTPHNTSSTRP